MRRAWLTCLAVLALAAPARASTRRRARRSSRRRSSSSSCPRAGRRDRERRASGAARARASAVASSCYAGAPPGALVATATTTKPLLPGASETLTIDVAAPAQPTTYRATVDPKDVVPECVEDNDTATLQGASCTPPAR